MARLTVRLVEQLSPRDAEYFAWDADVPGFGVRVQPGGRKAYVVKYRPLGSRQTRRYTLGTTSVLSLPQARELARDWLASIRQGHDPAQELRAQREAPTVAELATRYIEEHAAVKKRPSSARMDASNLRNHIVPTLGTRRVQAVSPEDVARLHHRMRATPGAANRVLALLSKMFALAELWGLRTRGSNPARGLPRYRERRMERYLSTEEVQRLWQALDQAEVQRTETPATVALLRLLLLTGARLGEILTLRWAHIDWERARAYLPQSKTGEKYLRLSPQALDVLRRLPRQEGNPWVIVGHIRGSHLVNPYKPWRRLCAAAGLSGVRIHDLRHTYASLGMRVGLSLPLVGAILGHTNPQTTQRYSHLADDPVQEGVERIDAAFRQVLGG